MRGEMVKKINKKRVFDLELVREELWAGKDK